MPSLGADMLHGTLVRWHVHPGDTVHRGDIVGEVETEKGVFDIDSVEEGVVEELLVPEGMRVPVQTPLARLRSGAPAGSAPAATPPAPPAPAPSAVSVLAPEAPAAAPAPATRVSPLARRVAADLGVDLTSVHGTGEGGAITRADVERAARDMMPATTPPPAPPPAAPDRTGEMRASMRAAIGAAMSRSKREIPHYYLSQELDASRMMDWLRDTNAARPLTNRILPVAVLLSAVARALAKFPEFNGHVVDGAFTPSDAVHLGVAVALRGGGLIAPALRDAQRQAPDALMPALLDLVDRTRRNRLRTSELSDATVTVTALAEGGVGQVFGVIYPPQVAIVGFGTIAERPWAVDGLLGVRHTVFATVSADHRVSDGHRAALLLGEIQRLLLAPETL